MFRSTEAFSGVTVAADNPFEVRDVIRNRLNMKFNKEHFYDLGIFILERRLIVTIRED